MTNQLLRTPLFESYKEYGGKTIDFGGWELPVQFSSIKAEHEAVRTKAGLFDVSHMGEVFVSGSGALDYLQKLVTNDVSKLTIGQAQYTVMCNEQGGTIDDFLIYKLEEERYLLVVNASNIEKDVAWMEKQQIDNVVIDNQSSNYALLALQGPVAESVLQKLTDESLKEIKFFRFKEHVQVGGEDVLVSRTGYTGENGFEIYGTPEAIQNLWSKILQEGKEDGVVPAGLGARDTLRFEAGLPLYGQELREDISPLEAGLGFVVKVKKEEDFIGKDILVKQKEQGIERKLVGLEMIDKGIPRTGYKVFEGDREIGEVTTGTQSPTLKKNIGFALLSTEFAELGTEVEVEIRAKRLKAKVIATPFYKRS
ncbi:glycine cleavage system protein T [Sporosarcina sp. P21c]|uniref:glycine cleavage system aminomethyltransferase GcvT n=1 Tax=unclassified Sporosarcina TaxID=2647733 RepID=UPI000C166476|nr:MULTISPECIES: glycine cleavage system aminomethyltransferase GcvT [unclassified Sporosarcina]PIC66941.1 glycine cleavage system protein T [Sporosarcina sp. P16a]PIC84787.1 glycine cleavage system protein T [Sporosarcina sp. P1]PIC89442.1 glycine cleavage system protein T [Sporosarcina sp. P21c]PIC92393.1 glycine cleavage system protein T [Sporosarcina sp. P25]